MKFIQCSKNVKAMVDDDVYEYLNQYKWFAKLNCKAWICWRNTTMINGVQRNHIYMHREIMSINDRKIQVGHIIHYDKSLRIINNMKSNLRIVTNQQNQMNQRKQSNCSSKFKGVTWDKIYKKWQARIMINRKSIHLGKFKDEIDAALAYDKRAKFEFGEYALLNFPQIINTH